MPQKVRNWKKHGRCILYYGPENWGNKMIEAKWKKRVKQKPGRTKYENSKTWKADEKIDTPCPGHLIKSQEEC